ncbi:hydrogenase maturation nickel metallochaperone HypA [Legionella longbeachae]|uniref:Hydrogenase maturation factor HypA n=1 Tax=Legionella longbeachae serogroup 1 (strain NSW150) TaxID=661367 RepID=D3HK98_LEGLN|nr:hydrogenase maturation nickel metallochaperone HypA [Legionella longbeachae]VEE03378.1 hydrogenase nickel incorporation protein HypA [Legionella oakridgensis]HBD7397654.1 hydrogenase maturation nickel metallochaperone HypA [Legionella pneumophila]ARB93728.1 hydrogenase maturation nickel metallochaperone HypA [Legionella longbeachae]ARM33132.1 hydrogenase maturation nickel metallochaperone HypA [Legionella longbeachae]EEZ94020.1 hydrogenase nickel insertion protein HypA [Legionella longbeach
MHELWLCKNILEIIKQNANDTQCTRVKKIILEIGELVAIEKNALIFSFNVITKGTLAENAEIDIIDISGKAFCESCQQLGPLQQYYDACHTCGSHALKIVQGEELRVKSMVVE